eukprot:scaffold45488_cov252-Amphora_coffeaeformis.AAC.1
MMMWAMMVSLISALAILFSEAFQGDFANNSANSNASALAPAVSIISEGNNEILGNATPLRFLQQTISGNLLVAVSVTRLDDFLVRIAFTDEEQVLGDITTTSTVFGLTDQAFLASNNPNLARLTLLGYRKLHLSYFVQTHMMENRAWTTEDLVNEGTITTKSGESFTVTRNGSSAAVVISSGTTASSSTITSPDIQADNGYLHVLNAPLLPSFVGRTVHQLPESRYSLLGQLIEAASNEDSSSAAVTMLLDTEVTQTLLAPTNTAIQALPAGMWDRILQLPTYADDLISLHIITNIYTVQDLRAINQLLPVGGESPPIFSWEMQAVTGGNELMDSVNVNGNFLSEPNILAWNGITHGMEGVFLPRGGPPTVAPTTSPTSSPTTIPTTFTPTSIPTSGSSPIIMYIAIICTAGFTQMWLF